jgi:hypothetical protein
MIETKSKSIDIRELVVDEPYVYKNKVQEILEQMNPDIWNDLNQLVRINKNAISKTGGAKGFLPAMGSLLNTMWEARIIAPKGKVDLSIDKMLEHRIKQALVMIQDEEFGWETYSGIAAYSKLLKPDLMSNIRLDEQVFRRMDKCLTDDEGPRGSDAIVDEDFLFHTVILFPNKMKDIVKNTGVQDTYKNYIKHAYFSVDTLHEYLAFTKLHFPQDFKDRGGVLEKEWEVLERNLLNQKEDIPKYGISLVMRLIYDMSILAASNIRWNDNGIQLIYDKPLREKVPQLPDRRRF